MERAYVAYKQRYGAGQTLERLIERGGFDASELDAFVPEWRTEESEIARLRAALETAERERDEARAERDAWRAKAEARPVVAPEDAGRYLTLVHEGWDVPAEAAVVVRVERALRAHASKAVG